MTPCSESLAPQHDESSARVAAELPAACSQPTERPAFQVTRAADYAVRAVIHLATLEAFASVSQAQLARAISVPMSFLAKVLQRLAARGFVASARGKQGGYSITDEGRGASMLEVVEAIDGPVLLNTCLAPGAPCIRASWCPAHPVWRETQRRMTEVLASVTIARLAATTHRQSGNIDEQHRPL